MVVAPSSQLHKHACKKQKHICFYSDNVLDSVFYYILINKFNKHVSPYFNQKHFLHYICIPYTIINPKEIMKISKLKHMVCYFLSKIVFYYLLNTCVTILNSLPTKYELTHLFLVQHIVHCEFCMYQVTAR